MEFSFDVGKVLFSQITVLDTDASESNIKIYSVEDKQDPNSSWIYHSTANPPWDIKLKKKKEDLETIIDNMGYASAQAQSLHGPITTLKKLLNSSNQKLYILRDIEDSRVVIGFLKIGIKRLFVCDDIGAHHQVDPLCVLDFYVHESKQRCGFGHELFDAMLQAEDVVPEKLAVDRPSLKFLSFLRKHYNLVDPLLQANNFVIFPGFFKNHKDTRPPIFLYCGKDLQPNQSKQQYPKSGSYKNEAEALSSIKVSLCSGELRKNKTFYSSAAKCLIWDNEDNNKRYHTPSSSSLPVSNNSNNSNMKSNSSWHGNSSIQGCTEVRKKLDGWSSNPSPTCPLPPVNNVPSYSKRKWKDMQSSWNIFGVKPVDYSMYQKQN